MPMLAGQMTLRLGTDCAASAAADVCIMLLISLHVSPDIPIMHTCLQPVCLHRSARGRIPKKSPLQANSKRGRAHLCQKGRRKGLFTFLAGPGTLAPPLHPSTLALISSTVGQTS